MKVQQNALCHINFQSEPIQWGMMQEGSLYPIYGRFMLLRNINEANLMIKYWNIMTGYFNTTITYALKFL